MKKSVSYILELHFSRRFILKRVQIVSDRTFTVVSQLLWSYYNVDSALLLLNNLTNKKIDWVL